MVNSSFELIGTGIAMGIVHVLTGPDHLSALATLSGTNIGHSVGHRDAFLLGIRWGIGHSAGLLVVGGILIAVESGSEWIDMDDNLSRVLESFVGVFMLCLGVYGLCKAFRNRAEASSSLSHVHTSFKLEDKSIRDGGEGFVGLEMTEKDDNHLDSSIVSRMEMSLAAEDDFNGDSEDEDHGIMEETEKRIFKAAQSLKRNSMSEQEYYGEENPTTSDGSWAQSTRSVVTVPIFSVPLGDKPPKLEGASSLVAKHSNKNFSSLVEPNASSFCIPNNSNSKNYFYCLCCGISDRNYCFCSPGSLALLTGIVHGVAGPGGVLGVIPAVQLKEVHLALLYLGTFCLTSTLVMGGFAMFYGSLSEWLAGGSDSIIEGSNRVFIVEICSSCLSICVGIVWLILLAIGKLGEVFP